MTGALTRFGSMLWLAEGGPVTGALGFRFPTRMAVMGLRDGGLALWSPVALSDALAREVEALGEVRHLIAPNGLHHLFLADWARAFPDAIRHGAPGLAEGQPDLGLDAVLGAAPHRDWAGEIEQVVVANSLTTEVVFFHRRSRTVLFTDLVQGMAPGTFPGWRAVVARLDLMTTGRPAVPRKFRLGFRDRAAARAAVGRILDWPAERLVMAHGAPLEAEGRDAVVRAFGWLLR